MYEIRRREDDPLLKSDDWSKAFLICVITFCIIVGFSAYKIAGCSERVAIKNLEVYKECIKMGHLPSQCEKLKQNTF